ncbi:UDP-N-acetylmuramoyl-L-alanine--D-glutamate ligase [Corynebacterium aquatimens]|uniref:UDP-N-acetylmuramoylalanine--D-glutamate ligase n=1 Tax=Corynebacterium aquatimens TaxID=1190508 RepID=A0A931GTM4_9CORY|nr:UDP-N-acetylmuramoyl-L-alanine--D-glutamate ligase [Corynebacterium aquatimens]MBG6121965.1 UDP-N-acetylmuramoylalanine--D-glutamate ligase [Corynebacterium aquatimens]WJY65496.1 UDP-N-acetylmuramoylalanine--D-glutamate ligase [Corynebacterium aquatimens]
MTSPIAGPVLIAGAGVSGLGAAKLLSTIGISCTVADDNEAARLRVAEETGARVISTHEAITTVHSDPNAYDIVVTSPGWRPDSPLLVAAREGGYDVIGDVELCYRLDRAGVFGAPREWLVVTGTNGKTTTTGMLAAMMEEASLDTGKRAVACGNIGVAVADALVDPHRVDVLVAELSSFQLYWSDHLTPDAGVLLNLADDHLDWHGNFDAYAEAKAKVLTGPIAVAGADDPLVAERVAATGRHDIIGFTLGEPQPGQVGVIDSMIVAHLGTDLSGEPVPVASAEGIEPAGMAGVLDALAASAVALTQGVTPEHIARALSRYKVSGHRGAVVHSAGGIDWIDNSKATNPHAADSAIGDLSPVVWIAGGQLKGADIDPLIAAHAHQFRAVALLGVDRGIIAASLAAHAPDVPVFITDSTDPVRAMKDVVFFAADHARSGDTVVLAPAAASLDMYTSMAQRGDLFADAARATRVNPVT